MTSGNPFPKEPVLSEEELDAGLDQQKVKNSEAVE